MGRAVTLLVDRELISVSGEFAGDERPVFAQPATEHLAIREAKIVTRECEVDTEQGRLRDWSERLRRWGMNSRPESYGLRLCQSSRHVTRRVAKRSGATNAARAGQVSSTSAAMAKPAAERDHPPPSAMVRGISRFVMYGLAYELSDSPLAAEDFAQEGFSAAQCR